MVRIGIWFAPSYSSISPSKMRTLGNVCVKMIALILLLPPLLALCTKKISKQRRARLREKIPKKNRYYRASARVSILFVHMRKKMERETLPKKRKGERKKRYQSRDTLPIPEMIQYIILLLCSASTWFPAPTGEWAPDDLLVLLFFFSLLRGHPPPGGLS